MKENPLQQLFLNDPTCFRQKLKVLVWLFKGGYLEYLHLRNVLLLQYLENW